MEIRASTRIEHRQRIVLLCSWRLLFCSYGNSHKVAVCLAGQFLRGAKLNAFNIRKRFSAALGASSTYDAFLATSTQQFEDRLLPETNASMVCDNIKTKGFDSCTAEATLYDGATFLAASSSLEFRLPNGLYPHRVSYVSRSCKFSRFLCESKAIFCCFATGSFVLFDNIAMYGVDSTR